VTDPAQSPVDSSRLIFVGGLHRSGTTPLSRVLADHSDISGLTETGVSEDEGQHLQSVYPAAITYGGAGRFALDARSHLTETSPLVTPANAAQLVRSWLPYWDSRRKFLLEKSPPNVVMSRFIQALFPESAQIFVIRNPVVVALSTKKWARFTSLDDLVRHWLAAHEILRADYPLLRRAYVLRYEDLIEDPDSELTRIATFLGLDTPIPTTLLQASHSARYEETWDGMRGGSPIARRRRAAIERRYAEPLAAYGYRVEDLGVRDPWSWAGATGS
jgi:hypothetical protein